MKNKDAKTIRRRIAENLIAYRQITNLTQNKLSALSKVSTAHIGSIENMRISASADVLNKLSYALNIDVSMLFARPTITFPGTGLGKINISPLTLKEGQAAIAFWTKDFGMEYHPIKTNSIQNALYWMAYLQAQDYNGRELINKAKKLHIPL